MRYVMLLVLLLCQAAFALDTSESAQSRFGQLHIKLADDKTRALRLDEQLLYQETGYFAMSHILQLGDADVILLKKMPADNAPNEFFFITLRSNSPAQFSATFVAGERPAQPVIQGETIVVNLGLKAGNLEIITYQNGQITVSKTPLEGKKANPEYCDYLYKHIYIGYVEGKKCELTPQDAVFDEGESPAEVYRRMMDNDPRLNETQFQALAKSSCNHKKTVRYNTFKKLVCGG